MPNKIERKWYFIDANGKILGRLATKVANILYGKKKVNYTPNLDMGDYVVVINANKVELTGRKKEQKTYYSHSGYPGGIKSITFDKLQEKQPEKIIFKAVSGMMPKNKLAKQALARLRVYQDEEIKEDRTKMTELTI